MAGRITKTCPHCLKNYQVYPSGAHRKFCSKACADAAQTGEQREIVCRRCGEKFLAVKDHGNWPVYCSRKCFDGDAPRPAGKECPSCGSIFIAGRSSRATTDGLRVFCSDKCRHEGLRNGLWKTCINCGNEYYLQPSRQAQRPDEGCCSAKCQHELQQGEGASNWKGGKHIDTGSGQRKQICKREEAVSDYLAEHRVIAAQFVGRFLERHEMMLHLNDKPADNRPENLFICASISEMRKRRNGTIPWPKESNLATYGKVDRVL